MGYRFSWGEYNFYRKSMKQMYGKKGPNKRKGFELTHIREYSRSLDAFVDRLWLIPYNDLLKSVLVEYHYFSLLRISEGVSSAKHGDIRGIMLCDIKFVGYVEQVLNGKSIKDKSREHFITHIHKHKTSRKMGSKTVVIGGSTDRIINPLLKLKVYMARRNKLFGANPWDKLFIWENGKVVTIKHMRLITIEVVSVNKLDVYYFSGHSYRIGMCTAMGCRNVPKSIMAKAGFWSLEDFHTIDCYLRANDYDLIDLVEFIIKTPRKFYKLFKPKFH